MILAHLILNVLLYFIVKLALISYISDLVWWMKAPLLERCQALLFALDTPPPTNDE